MIFKKQIHLFFLVFILPILFIASCIDQTIDPIEDESGIYSFYGTLEVGTSQNVVRVRNLNEPFLSPSDSFNGTVTFEDLETGEITTLRDSVVEFSGNFTHNFIIDNEIEHNKEYKLKAVRSDGETVQSIARTPGVTNIQLTPDEEILCETQIDFRFQNVINPESVQVSITVDHNNQTHTAPLNIFINELDYSAVNDNEMRLQLSPRNLLTEVFPPILPDNPNFNPFNLFPTVGCATLQNKRITITYTHFGAEWATGRPSRGLIDIESGDVENGLGFFGSFRRDTFSFNYGTEQD